MDVEPDLPLDIRSWAFNVVVAPEEVAIRLLRDCLGQRRFLSLYVCGNYSRLLSRIGIRNAEFDVRRAFTASQLLSIADEAHHTFVFIEHDPTLYSESDEVGDCVSLALRELARESTVVLYSAGFDEQLRLIARRADRVFCVERIATRTVRPRREARGRVRFGPLSESQKTLEEV
jgi:hypothetical protein